MKDSLDLEKKYEYEAFIDSLADKYDDSIRLLAKELNSYIEAIEMELKEQGYETSNADELIKDILREEGLDV